MLRFIVALAVTLSVWVSDARAGFLPFPGFTRVSGPEELHPRFDVAGGQTTTRTYSGLVEVFVTGSGLNNVNNPDYRTDAFYNFFAGTNASDGLFGNSLRVGSETQILVTPLAYTWYPNSSLSFEADSLHVAELAIVYEGTSFPVSGAVPLDVVDGLAAVYNPKHEYHFVMELLGYKGTLTLGYGDGGAFDNSSDTYDITLYQVEQQVVPAPAGIVLGVVGFLTLCAGAGVKRLRQRRVSIGSTP